MIDVGGGGRRRVLVPQALGADEFLRVTWHEERQVMVFSHWQGDQCVAATPVRVSELGGLAELVVASVVRSGADGGGTIWSPWPSPDLDGLVATSLPLARSA